MMLAVLVGKLDEYRSSTYGRLSVQVRLALALASPSPSTDRTCLSPVQVSQPETHLAMLHS